MVVVLECCRYLDRKWMIGDELDCKLVY